MSGLATRRASTLIRMLARGDDRGEVADSVTVMEQGRRQDQYGLARRRAAERILFHLIALFGCLPVALAAVPWPSRLGAPAVFDVVAQGAGS